MARGRRMMYSNHPSRAHSGIGLPAIVVCAAGLLAAVMFDRLAPPIQRAILVPVAGNPVIWGLWNVLWVAAGSRRLPIGWHGTMLGVLLIATGVLAAPSLQVSAITPWIGAAVLLPTGLAYYVLWRWGVAFLNSVLAVECDGRSE
jgi:hypothetical protein